MLEEAGVFPGPLVQGDQEQVQRMATWQDALARTKMHVRGNKLAVGFGLLEKPAEDGMQREVGCTKDVRYL